MASQSRISGNWRLGVSLTLITCFMWGVLPVLLSWVLPKMDALTITFYRFSVAASLLLVWLVLHPKKQIYNPGTKKRYRFAVLVAGIMLAANYTLYLLALERMTPAAAQVLIQLAPMMLLLSGVFVFGERLTAVQWAGVATFVIGLLLFFSHRIREMLVHLDEYAVGMLLMFFAAVTWAIYASTQKQLLSVFSSSQLMFYFNACGAIVLLPLVQPAQVLVLTPTETIILFLCGINTLLAYGSFTEAMEHWEASKISALFSIVPVLTLIFIALSNRFLGSELAQEPAHTTLFIGIALVVSGAALSSLNPKRFRLRT